MKKVYTLMLCTLATALVFAGCSDNDGDVSSNGDNSSAVTTTADKNDTDSAVTEAESKAEGAVDKIESKADNVGDDIADGIDDGLDTAESLVDDVLR
jgi:PBP1b-binding outer membrane lipoprotein LpoB